MTAEAASIAVDALEWKVDSRIWRTRLRIQELILTENPYLEKNPFIFDQKLFLFIILNFIFSWSITTLNSKQVFDSWEKFEEADFEPVLYDDLSRLQGNAEYAALVERIYQGWMVEWKEFGQIKSEMSIIARVQVPQLMAQLNTNWLVSSNIFYKLPHGSNDTNRTSLPQLPAYI